MEEPLLGGAQALDELGPGAVRVAGEHEQVGVLAQGGERDGGGGVPGVLVGAQRARHDRRVGAQRRGEQDAGHLGEAGEAGEAGEVDQLVLVHPVGRDDEAAKRGGVLSDLVAQGEEPLAVQEEARQQSVAQHLVEHRDDGDRAGMPGPREGLGERGIEERFSGTGPTLPA